MTISLRLRQHARHRPDKPAIIEGDRRISYRTLDRMVDHTAHVLKKMDIGAGTLVGLALKDRAEYLVMLLALGRAGAVVLPLDPRWTQDETRRVCALFGADRVLGEEPGDLPGWMPVSGDWYGESAIAFDDSAVGDEAPMLLSLSSGTTGIPKGPRISHRKFIDRFMVYWIDLGLSAQDRFVTATPLYFGGGRGFALAMIHAGGTSVLHCPPFEPQDLVEVVGALNATAMFLVPTQLRRLLQLRLDDLAFPTLRVLICSGAALYAAEAREIRTRLTPNLYQYYSSTEGGGCTLLPPDLFEAHPDSVGQPCFGVDVEVVAEDHRPVGVGETGRVRYRSAASADGYFNSEDSAAFHEGWFYPGDLGSFDPQGFLQLRGRSKDMIIRGGVNIYPIDVERILADFPNVAEAAVVGVPSPEFGEEIAACVVASGPVTEAALRAHCAAHLAKYKMPKYFHFLEALPKTSLGKVMKSELAKQLAPRR